MHKTNKQTNQQTQMSNNIRIFTQTAVVTPPKGMTKATFAAFIALNGCVEGSAPVTINQFGPQVHNKPNVEQVVIQAHPKPAEAIPVRNRCTARASTGFVNPHSRRLQGNQLTRIYSETRFYVVPASELDRRVG